MSSNREIGAHAENKAAEYLKQKGYHILEQNFRTPLGEIDIIAKKKRDIVFCEVKYRKGVKAPSLEMINKDKQKKIIKAAYAYIKKNEHKWKKPYDFRFDALGLSDREVIHIEGAFYEC